MFCCSGAMCVRTAAVVTWCESLSQVSNGGNLLFFFSSNVRGRIKACVRLRFTRDATICSATAPSGGQSLSPRPRSSSLSHFDLNYASCIYSWYFWNISLQFWRDAFSDMQKVFLHRNNLLYLLPQLNFIISALHQHNTTLTIRKYEISFFMYHSATYSSFILQVNKIYPGK